MTSDKQRFGGVAGVKAFAFLGFVLALGAAACGRSDGAEDSGDDEAVATEAELRTRGIKSIHVELSGEFGPAPVPGGCVRGGFWTFEFEEKKLSGDACIGSTPTLVSKTLSEADTERVRKAVSKVRITRAPDECAVDAPVSRLDVFRATSHASYIDARVACGVTSTPVREATLAELVSLLEELSAPNPLPPCRRTGCSGNVCADSDRMTRCDWQPEYACYRTAICERNASGQCGFRQTPELTTCLADN